MRTLLIALLVVTSFSVKAQDYMTRTGRISFFSKTAMENIDGNNLQVSSAFTSKTGDLLFSVIIKSFEFKKALMQEHFNEKYMESDKFPKATFKGKIVDMSKVNLAKDGTYNVEVTGELMIHGTTQNVTQKGTLEVKGGELNMKATFPVKPKDYKIEIPALVKEKIAESIDVNVDMNYKKK